MERACEQRACTRRPCTQARWEGRQAVGLATGRRARTHTHTRAHACAHPWDRGALWAPGQGWPGRGLRPGMLVVMVAADRDPRKQQGLHVGAVPGPWWESRWSLSPWSLSLLHLLLHEASGLSTRTGRAWLRQEMVSVSYYRTDMYRWASQ